MPDTHQDHKGMASCIDTCRDCSEVCIEVIQHCLTKGGKHSAAEHIGLLLDCVDICDVSARFMLRGSILHTETCGVCADVCEACAESCDELSDDAELKRCADACRQCADECEAMSSQL